MIGIYAMIIAGNILAVMHPTLGEGQDAALPKQWGLLCSKRAEVNGAVHDLQLAVVRGKRPVPFPGYEYTFQFLDIAQSGDRVTPSKRRLILELPDIRTHDRADMPLPKRSGVIVTDEAAETFHLVVAKSPQGTILMRVYSVAFTELDRKEDDRVPRLPDPLQVEVRCRSHEEFCAVTDAVVKGSELSISLGTTDDKSKFRTVDIRLKTSSADDAGPDPGAPGGGGK